MDVRLGAAVIVRPLQGQVAQWQPEGQTIVS